MNIEQYSKLILENEEAYEEVQRRILKRMLNSFKTGTTEERDNITAMLDAQDIFIAELKLITIEKGDINE